MSEVREMLDRAGIFRTQPYEFGIEDKNGQMDQNGNKVWTVTINIKHMVLEQLNGDGQWDDWRNYQVDAESRHVIIKRDGTVNETTYRQLMQSLQWDGDIDHLFAPREWPGVQLQVKEDTYNGVTRYRGTG